ncbi:MAG TPA: biotin/lipoyl-binding protein [Spirochaetes bacterium]|nr:biotin/lipoyl-binding protein [Spirochaetota bacterium]
MRKFNVTVNGATYVVEVEEVSSGAPVPSARPIAPSSPAPSAPGTARPAPSVPAGGKTVTAPMPGTILSIAAGLGEVVKKGQVLLVLEAMKMENEIRAGVDGAVASIAVKVGDVVNTGQLMIELS